MLGFIFLLLSCLLIVYTHPLLSHAHDTLDQNQSIKDGQSLVSSGDIFELGFFSPGNSTFRYVGIWYKNVSTQTVVWVANRQAPITGFNGSLTIKSNGNMVVLNGSGNALWSTNSSTESKNFTAQLMDSANFVLQESDGTVLWESFDYPTDTFVPGMTILRDSKKGMNQNQILTSWRSPNDPSIGEYSLGLDHRGTAQFFIWQGTAPRWRSGQWNGETFIGTMIRPLYMYGFRLTNDVSDGIMYFTFTPFNTSLLRFVLQENGVEKTSMLVEGNQWESVWMQPLNECDIYNKCGDNAVCVYKNAATCNCLRGFEPKSKDEWGRGNWSGGCVRRTPLQCQSNASSSVGGEADGFFAIQGVKVPDLSDWASTVESEAGCQYACLNNCSCKAYAFPSGIGCLIWSHDLIDMYQFAQGGSVLNLKLAASELGSNHKTWKIIVAILCTLGVASLIICLFFWWKYNARIKNWWKKRGKGESLSNTDFLSGPNVDGDEGRSSELPFYRFDQLANATNKFSDSKKLGQGGFGDVYKGILPGGQEVAVKRLSASSGQGMEEFKNEVILIAKLQHRNLVRLVGCCIQGEEKILVYEYMPNKSLDAFLFETTKQALLNWGIRFNIIEYISIGIRGYESFIAISRLATSCWMRT